MEKGDLNGLVRLLVPEVRRQWPDWFLLTVIQTTTHYNQGLQNSISEQTTDQTLKQQLRLQLQKTTLPLLLAKTRELRLHFTWAYQNSTTEDWKKSRSI